MNPGPQYWMNVKNSVIFTSDPPSPGCFHSFRSLHSPRSNGWRESKKNYRKYDGLKPVSRIPVPDWSLSAGGGARLGGRGRGIVALHVGGEPRPARYRWQRVHREQCTNILSIQPTSDTKYGSYKRCSHYYTRSSCFYFVTNMKNVYCRMYR